MTDPWQHTTPQHPKSRTALIVIGVLAAALLVSGGLIAALQPWNSKSDDDSATSDTSDTSTSLIPPSPTPTVTDRTLSLEYGVTATLRLHEDWKTVPVTIGAKPDNAFAVVRADDPRTTAELQKDISMADRAEGISDLGLDVAFLNAGLCPENVAALPVGGFDFLDIKVTDKVGFHAKVSKGIMRVDSTYCIRLDSVAADPTAAPLSTPAIDLARTFSENGTLTARR